MKTNSIIPFVCAFAASAIAACSGDSQLTGPNDDVLQRPVVYAASSAEDGTSDGELKPVEESEGQPTDGGGQAAGGGQVSGPGSGTGTGGRPIPGGNGGTPTGDPGQPVMTRAIEEFLNVQGSYCVDDGNGGCHTYAWPVNNYLQWYDQRQGMTMAIDYAGIAGRWAEQRGVKNNAQISGSVSEKILDDGSAVVTVQLTGSGVSSYATGGPNLQGPVFFGVQPQMMLDPAANVASGDLRMTITFLSRPGHPLPDLIQLIRAPRDGQRLLGINFDYNGRGAYYAGSPEGKNGTMNVRFDGSQEVMSASPYDPGNTAPTGFAEMNFTAESTW